MHISQPLVPRILAQAYALDLDVTAEMMDEAVIQAGQGDLVALDPEWPGYKKLPKVTVTTTFSPTATVSVAPLKDAP